MVFELDTRDMERHSVELRLYLEKAARRFEKAQMRDAYERIVKNQLPQLDLNGPNVLQLDQLSSAEESRRLTAFLGRLIDACNRSEHHERLQSALRDSLYQSRRKSITIGSQPEPFCYFCAGGVCPPEGAYNLDDHEHQEQPLNGHQDLIPFPAIELVMPRAPAGNTRRVPPTPSPTPSEQAPVHQQHQQHQQTLSCPPNGIANGHLNGQQQQAVSQAFLAQFYEQQPHSQPATGGHLARGSPPTGMVTPLSMPSTTPPLDGTGVQDLSTRNGASSSSSNGTSSSSNGTYVASNNCSQIVNGGTHNGGNQNGAHNFASFATFKRKLELVEDEPEENIDVDGQTDDGNSLQAEFNAATNLLKAANAVRRRRGRPSKSLSAIVKKPQP